MIIYLEVFLHWILYSNNKMEISKNQSDFEPQMHFTQGKNILVVYLHQILKFQLSETHQNIWAKKKFIAENKKKLN